MKVQKVSTIGLFLLFVLASLLVSAAAFAQGEGFFTLSQGETRVQITPLESAVSAADYYNYENGVANTGLERVNTAVLFLYRETGTGTVSLFVILSGEPGSAAGSTTVTLSGVPTGADFLVKDDPDDFRDSWQISPPTGSFSNNWDAEKGDGAVIGPLGTGFSMTLYPQFTSGITQVVVLSGPLSSPQSTTLNLTDPIVFSATSHVPPVASFTVSPTEPRSNEVVTFDASSSTAASGSHIVTYDWDFNSDGIFDLSTSDPRATYTYAAAGTYTVTLRATDDQGASARQSFVVTVSTLSVTVTRTISTTEALPGSTFKVVVRIESQRDLAGAGLQENLPVGWAIKPIENAGAAFKRAAVQWVFVDEIKAGTTKVISYEVTVPNGQELFAATLPVCFTISGIFQAITPRFEMPVAGDSKVQVSSALDILVAIAHLVPRTSPDGQDSIDLRLSEKIGSGQLDRALEMWRDDEAVPWTQGARIDLVTMKTLAAYAYTCTPVDMALPLVPQATITAVRTIAAPVPCRNVLLNYFGPDGRPAGNTFTVKVEISADQDLYGVGLHEELPTGWQVTPIQNDEFTFKASRIEWVLPTKLPARTTKTIIYQVEVPQTESIEMMGSNPCYVSSNDLSGVVDSALPCQDVVVTGDAGVDITNCLSAIVAISRWDVERDTIDISLSNKISFLQVQRAIAFWLEDEVVPRTCGQTIDYETLKTIIAYWLTGTDICDPLPAAVRGTCEPAPAPCGQ